MDLTSATMIVAATSQRKMRKPDGDTSEARLPGPTIHSENPAATRSATSSSVRAKTACAAWCLRAPRFGSPRRLALRPQCRLLLDAVPRLYPFDPDPPSGIPVSLPSP